MILGLILVALIAFVVIYYIYRQHTDPGLSLFPNNQPEDAYKHARTDNNI
ncbi:MAG: hypothetical protein ACYCX4_07350 [Bacillota bacterium]